MKKVLSVLFLTAFLFFIQGCGGPAKQQSEDHKFAGTFEDEYGDIFTLNKDMTTSIQFKNTPKEYKGKWNDGENHSRPYATIDFNGDPNYYYLRDGYLYRYRQDMDEGRCKIKISYKN